jgi:glutamine synthetase
MAVTKNEPYALSNPLSVLLQKPPEDFARADMLRVIAEKGIERITFHYTGLDGKLKELRIPVADAAQAESVLAEGERADGSSLFKGMVDTAVSDLYVVPVYRTAFLNPFDEAGLDFVCRYLAKDGEPAPFAPDNILARAAGLFRANTGLDMRALGELEFFLLGEAKGNLFVPPKQQGYHGSAPFIKSGPILNEMVRHITRITGAVKYAHSEVGFLARVQSENAEIDGRRAEQLEIEFLPRPIVEMADDLVIARWVIRNVASQHGCVATFAPKIEDGVAGNGLHVHMEIARDGRSVMTGAAVADDSAIKDGLVVADGRLSEEARRLIGGLLEYADTLTAFGNTVSAAYLRLVPHQEAPTRICWSDFNRSVLIRVPLGWNNLQGLSRRVNPRDGAEFSRTESRQTVEFRSPDGSANVHLLLAGLAMAADWGFGNAKSALVPGKTPLELAEYLYVKGNIFDNKELLNRLPELPASCVASGRLLLAKRGLYERDGVFPASVIDYAARALDAEKDEFMNQTLLIDLPVDQRLVATRRIMHKDLHRN